LWDAWGAAKCHDYRTTSMVRCSREYPRQNENHALE
jgi:hypothetical protein